MGKVAVRSRKPSVIALWLVGLVLGLTGPALAAAPGVPDFADKRDFDFASRGFIATRKDPLIRDADGKVVYDLNQFAFLNKPKDTINPSLQRQGQLLTKNGLFKVVDGIWQVRGFDLSNITFIRGKTGWIVIDPLVTPPTAKAAYELVTEHLGRRPVVAVIYTHSHADHYGGVAGVVSRADVQAGRVQIIAPEGFMDSTMREWLIAGNAMLRRAEFQGGSGVPRGPEGFATIGLGNAGSTGAWSLIPPTLSISPANAEQTIDGVRVVFQMTPGTEAPAEMNMYFPDFRILDLAENASATMHNVLTPRGAEVRDAKGWADDLTDSIRRFGGTTDVVIMSHTWPRFGNAAANEFMVKMRDAYKFLHDQSVRLMNKGLTGAEIANRLRLPPSLSSEWYNRGYYGSLSFNSRAVYQRYMGWYDANPANLAVFEPAEESRRYVEAMGGRDHVYVLAKQAIDAKDDQWAVQLLNRLVMKDAKDQAARDTLAECYTRLAYAQENGVWRNIYLEAALELRSGVPEKSLATMDKPEMLAGLPTPYLLDLLSVRLDPEKVGAEAATIDVIFPDRNEHYRIAVRNDVLTYEANPPDAKVDATVTMPRMQFLKLLATHKLEDGANVEGSADKVTALSTWFEAPSSRFPVVWREQ